MNRPEFTEEDGQRALRDHIIDKATAARAKYGPEITFDVIQEILRDPEIVRYPTTTGFDAEALETGEFAHAQPLGDHPSKGFCIVVHPLFESRVDVLPLLIAYHIASVNYGDIVSHEDAELFGATLLGMEVDAYYDKLCFLADSIVDSGG